MYLSAMKKFFLLFFLSISLSSLAQRDSLQLGEKYAEDQIYLLISYNQMFNLPRGLSNNDFSYGLSGGFIKDFTLNKQGSFAVGLGVGYSYDYLNHYLRIDENNGDYIFSDGTDLSSNVFLQHSLEFPFEIRWRTSTAQNYSFWRIYAGIKFSYNLTNKFRYVDNGVRYSFNNIPNFTFYKTQAVPKTEKKPIKNPI